MHFVGGQHASRMWGLDARCNTKPDLEQMLEQKHCIISRAPELESSALTIFNGGKEPGNAFIRTALNATLILGDS